MTGYNSEEWEPNTSDIECPRCGESFFYELTSCPNCGLSVYPDENGSDYEDDSDRDFLEELLSEFAGPATVFMGLVVSLISGTVIFMALRAVLGESIYSWPGRGVMLLAAPIGAAIGGYLAAYFSKTDPRGNGFWVGGLTIIAAVVFSAVDSIRVGGWFGLETIPLWTFTVLSGAAGGEFWRRQQRDVVIQQLFGDLTPEEDLYKELMSKINHDAGRAERLIEFEKQFMPNATRRTLIESAIQRWDRDNS